MCPRAGHGRRDASASAIGPHVRALLGLHITVTYRPGPSNDLKQPIVTQKQGKADGPHRRGHEKAVMLQIKPQYNINNTQC
ncbi:hypothetical protein DPMN_160523 [Dreissena polymorpha]|uniref:Uncharacterized protein n=1 Tax=Dreissena polymorpha TaxID=45954 RepID=A0A9D4EME2_DREPO|nr:hypothetical protein DPMN_160523 [Dreissena polymorpha]